MPAYEDLDAFKACHQLTLAVGRVHQSLEERDAELANRLWAAAITAASRIARGAGFRNPRMFAPCVGRTAAALAEFESYLELLRDLELIATEDHRELESLAGRALFYVCKLAASLEATKA